MNKKNDNLQTPSWVWKSLGKIDLDPCAGINTRIGINNYSIEDGKNGLLLPWHGFVFCNPPFSQKEIWIEKMKNHACGILLLPERGSAPWFAPTAIKAINIFVMGKKIDFDGGSSSNNVGSCLFLFGELAIQRIMSSWLPGYLAEIKNYTDRKGNRIVLKD